ncbi:hypothetical protein PQE72_gp185 [Bacillus phage vB_BanS_Skywalker]|uniref:Uncharacterized protein n=3 Tax=Caudoviricetes TaxID=2731619 RepID=A0AAE8YWL7_9CAUD|nr:hypothetical protein PQE72_gp185 [Bacillus phage vB_BanS_Skywalker]YP_010681063.1 hypothetical protein PQE73_gp167 [Bacillus phage vB_BanS_MrDarsey]UGO47999.1 hypothetical protein MRDARSEY_167 [Bacillus phage vB_BanS_MrDarsey]UGO51258.1 hypothetical protein SKYWALKER_101 [Bacillus phage vB_BanS_Skywalker]
MDLNKFMPDFHQPVLVLKTKVTRETRRDSYEDILSTLGERQKNVYQTLKASFPEGATAKELAVLMFESKLVGSPERNSTHPRLNELVEKGLVTIIGKKTCVYTDRRVAIYQTK